MADLFRDGGFEETEVGRALVWHVILQHANQDRQGMAVRSFHY